LGALAVKDSPHNEASTEIATQDIPTSTPPKLKLRGLVVGLFYMVSGGPFGLEELAGSVGFLPSIPILVLLPLLWSVPVALMLGELAAALPEAGGYYAWVRRALGPFWGFQEAWLSMAASVFDMAIYPTLFALYTVQLIPSAAPYAKLIAFAMLTACFLLNLLDMRKIEQSTVLLCVLTLVPFLVLALCNFLGIGGVTSVDEAATTSALPKTAPTHLDAFLTATVVGMWNYMGWDNATTLAAEVENPKQSYPRAIAIAHILVAACYIVPMLAAHVSGVEARTWETGSWVQHATRVHAGLGLVVTFAALTSSVGMCSSLMSSYARLPVALAEDGLLPRTLLKRNKAGAPYWALFLCYLLWIPALGFGFQRLVVLDIVLYGGSLLLEFVALIVLRVHEPELPRPVRVPGGIPFLVALSVGPTLLLGLALIRNRAEQAWGMPAIGFVVGVALLGVLVYPIMSRRSHPSESQSGAP
jgi:amino acid transporter